MYAASLDRLPLLLGAAPTVSFTVMIVGNLVVTSRRGVPRGRWIRHPDEEALLLERFVRGETERVRADVVQPAYDRHAVRLHLEAGVMIKAVPTQLSRLLGNLLDNAQRHARSASA